ncbi:MAG: hypothetical protein IPM63_09395 [Acidobacteriota bacterium]|nr:MAG: hypothetical protein IPM63_09395 [Acidobacteriota bacterium]
MIKRLHHGSFRVSSAALPFLFVLAVFVNGCGSAASSDPAATAAKADANPLTAADPAAAPVMPAGPSIDIKANSPADTVKVFYERLRANRFIDALKLTNLRPAVEGLTPEDVKDLGVDFSEVASSVPPQMPINGEIVSGDEATVTMKMPNEKDGKIETNEIRLRKEGDVWIMLVADPEGERAVRKEGKNYFFSLRMEVHHREAQAMLERINKAQGIYALQNQGKFADLETLANKGYVPADALSAESTGYNYKIALAFDRSTYTVHATPAVYGKTGRLSFASRIRKGKDPELVSRDSKGEILQN